MGSRFITVPELQYVDRTFPNAADNLAFDEALLDSCDRGESPGALRVWEPESHLVVVGYSNRDFDGVRLGVCQRSGVPVLRRHSGGGTVLLGPGCLNYALVLQVDSDASLSSIRETNRFVMEKHRLVVERLTGRPVTATGFTDLAMNGRKVSGNAQYRKRNALLFHGTFLLDFDLSMVESLLDMPSVAPDYRDGRSHVEFLANIDIRAQLLKAELRQKWNARFEHDATRPLYRANYPHLDLET